ncbi:Zn(II)2Cys6 transcription factor [Aspergillus lucknowensis]|uniref:C6 transcription factor n=1 Tax=Aspergillus lucknowensis TaxID=176173 RepID=A0ABR4LL83_9EURO
MADSDDTRAPRGGRQRVACDLCRHKKIRCDGEKPACETCRLAGVTCTLTVLERPQKKSIKVQLLEAKSRIRNLEERERRAAGSPPKTLQPEATLHIRDPANVNSALEIFRWHLDCSGPLSPNSPAKEAFLSSVYHRTGRPFDLDLFSALVVASQNQRRTMRPSGIVVPKWPDNDLIQQCISHYINQHLYSMFPTLEPSKAYTLFEEYASGSLDERRHIVAKACLSAFAAFISLIHRHHPSFAKAEPDSYMRAALTLLPHLILEPSNVEALQAILIIAQYITPAGEADAGKLLLGIAVRILYNLGAHRKHSTPAETREHTHLRALFWACYAMDREMSIRSSQPPLINDADCDLDLPPNYVQSTSDRQFLDEPLSSDILLYPSDLRFSLFKSKLYRLLYSKQAQTHPEARRLEYIRQLDHELSELKASFPVHFQPDPEAYLRPNYKVHDFSLRGMNIHLEYYYCLRMIHEASIASSMSHSGGTAPLASSVELYYHAVRSTLLYFIRVEGLIQPPTVWIHAQFVLSSTIALFWNMIENPTAPTFHEDLRLLEQMKELFTRLCRNCRDVAHLPPLFIFDKFLGMLLDFSGEALARATRS